MSGLDLVVGGCGFIGSHIVEALLLQGRRVRVLDDLSTGYAYNIKDLACEFHQGDAADAKLAANACNGVERIFHLGARPSVPWSFQEPELAYHANHGTTLALIEAASQAGVKRLVFSSSSAIYGDSPVLPKREDMQAAPKSPYAEHKLAGEVALHQAAQAGKLEATSLRYFNVYGPRQDPSSPYSGVISLFAQWIQQQQDPTFYGDGQQTRDFVYVGDVVKANLLAAEAPQIAAAPVYNVASGSCISIAELWNTLCMVAGCAAGTPTFLESRVGDVRHSSACLEKIGRELGFHADFDLRQGLEQTLHRLS
jgi:UDP-glucose 4-epimerase